MEQELKSHLRALADAFQPHSKLAPATMWARAANDARFLDRIEGGKGFTIKTYDAAVKWFADNWPEGAVWPDDVPRPREVADDNLSPSERPRHTPKPVAEAGSAETGVEEIELGDAA